jgi:hypothetical protein
MQVGVLQNGENREKSRKKTKIQKNPEKQEETGKIRKNRVFL